ncbi:hypothetical protein BCR34DRAFT_247491 [Clohesyomyces aquaticus]|uniref:Uncharacterized protein n=1 Tax=Clohesyomyces aquaticus TaxID=1231657 RepID=A0A1Y1Y4M9_9PLEO|nr:hypothetical protein BCR34DRAFT_247491 [Clohesyomyces aquaticus]
MSVQPASCHCEYCSIEKSARSAQGGIGQVAPPESCELQKVNFRRRASGPSSLAPFPFLFPASESHQERALPMRCHTAGETCPRGLHCGIAPAVSEIWRRKCHVSLPCVCSGQSQPFGEPPIGLVQPLTLTTNPPECLFFCTPLNGRSSVGKSGESVSVTVSFHSPRALRSVLSGVWTSVSLFHSTQLCVASQRVRRSGASEKLFSVHRTSVMSIHLLTPNRAATKVSRSLFCQQLVYAAAKYSTSILPVIFRARIYLAISISRPNKVPPFPLAFLF